jgi:hypothetical protein
MVARAEQSPKRMIYGHYMGCYPVGTKAIAYHYRTQDRDTSLDLKKPSAQIGGGFVNYPLVPRSWVYNEKGEVPLRQSIELEIKRAMRAGLDGFAIDAWAGGEFCKEVLQMMLDICKEKKLPFYATLCMDASCHAVKTDRYDDSAGGHMGGLYDSVRYLLSNFKDHPNLARREGKPLIFTYQADVFLPIEKRTIGNGLTEEKRWQEILIAINGLRDMTRREFGTDIFLHYDISNAFSRINLKNIKDSRPPHQPGPIMADLAFYLTKGDGDLQAMDAIGGFLGENWLPEFPLIADKIHQTGKTWSIPMWHQYDNRGGSLKIKNGTDRMRQLWDMARKSNSSLIQYVTWNDYGEDTNLAPGVATRYTVLDLTAHQIAWWKTGKEPVYDRDKVYLIYRRYSGNDYTFPYYSHRFIEGVLEVSTILTKPATIKLLGRSEGYQAPAGLYVKQFPVTPGPVIVQIIRNGKVTLNVESPDPITDKPWREANGMVCYSSEYERLWKEDFPDEAVQTFAESGDLDHDGLPNWFEMLWFGKLGDYTTAMAADPQADPDEDGLTNLQEYQKQSNPKVKDLPYQAGYVWDYSTASKNRISFNPDSDSHSNRIWYYLYNMGETPVSADGNYMLTPYSVNRDNHALHSLPYDDELNKNVHGWISIPFDMTDDGHILHMKPNINSNAIIAWKSPIEGTVSLDITTAVRENIQRSGTLTIQHNNPLRTLKTELIPGNQSVNIHIPSIKVKAGDMIYMVGSSLPHRMDLKIKSLNITLLSK